MEEYLFNRFGQESLLVLRTLTNRPYVDDKELTKLTLLEKKRLGQVVNPLLQLGLVQFYELKVSGANMMTYFVEEDKLRRWCTEQLCRVLINLHRRSAAIAQKRERTVTGGETEQLLKLEASMLELDELLILIS